MLLAGSGRITRYPGVEQSSNESANTIGEENSHLTCNGNIYLWLSPLEDTPSLQMASAIMAEPPG